MGEAARVMARADALGRCSEEPGRLVRPFGSRAMREAGALVAGWMGEAGMAARRDAIGNLIGRYEGEDGGTLLLVSHLDTVRDAGRYDGALGVLVALAVVERLHERGERLPFAVEVVGFADEEGLRFGTTYLASSAFAGAFDARVLGLRDAAGVTLADALRALGADPAALAGAGRATDDLIGCCEVHIEQGPVLEHAGLPVGVVTAIAGQSRVGVQLTGQAGHAGTVPMAERRDALCAAAELVLAVEAAARDEPGLVATVGELAVRPGAANVIPGAVALSLDVRHPDDGARERACRSLRRRLDTLAAARGVHARWELRQQAGAVRTDPALTALLETAVEQAGVRVERLASGAGHDTAQIAAVAPVAMLFVRCAGGVSHDPAESIEPEDAGVAIDVLERFVRLAPAR